MNHHTPTTLHSGKFLTVIKEGYWEYVTRLNAAGAAVIVAVTEEQKLLLVEQYRIPVHTRTIKLPAGIIGDEPGCTDESHAEAARRELLEETGYAAAHIEHLTSGPSGAGLTLRARDALSRHRLAPRRKRRRRCPRRNRRPRSPSGRSYRVAGVKSPNRSSD